MYVQNQIYSQLSSEAGLAKVQELLSCERFETRTAAGRAVCGLFDFRDARGNLQQSGCLKALRRLERSGDLSLPEPRRVGRQAGGRAEPRGLGGEVPPPRDVPGRVDRIRELRLTAVCGDSRMRLWNELMRREHPCGAVIHTGCQMRYIIESEHGILGAIGFSASALTLEVRNRWIGWSAEQRGLHLHRSVGMSRFLIRPGVRCHNLASRALGMALGRLGDDFDERYGYRPYLVETFTDPAQHGGVSLKASNWRCVGETKGRGRMAETGARVAVKSVWMYELERSWRELLELPDPFRIEPRTAGEGLDCGNWAQQEFGGAPIGDERLSRRLVTSAQVQASAPMASFPAAAQGDKALVYGHYRLIDKPKESEVTVSNILAPHRGLTLERMQNCAEVLCIQDGTDLNFAEHGQCRDMEHISRNRNSAGTLGIHMHSQFVVNGSGVPLGVPHIQYGSIEDREKYERGKMQRWLEGLYESSRLAKRLDGVRVVSVCDREADFFELYVEARKLRSVEVLVRADHNRVLEKRRVQRGKIRVTENVCLFDRVRSQPVAGELAVHIEHQSERRATRRQAASKGRSKRTAQVEVRWLAVDVPPPSNEKHLKDEAPVRLNAVHVFEPSAPAGEDALEWLLLTTLPVDAFEQAVQVVERYRLRWRVEDWHRVLKHGCRVEDLAHESRERMERAVTINAVIAWRLSAMVLLCRETPELPPEVLFSDTEVAVLKDFIKGRKMLEVNNLGAAVIAVAVMGGYLNRRSDPPPGYKKIWEGYTQLSMMVKGCELMLRAGTEGNLYRLMRPDKRCD